MRSQAARMPMTSTWQPRRTSMPGTTTRRRRTSQMMNASIECVWEMHRRKTIEKMLILTPSDSKSRLRRLLRAARQEAEAHSHF